MSLVPVVAGGGGAPVNQRMNIPAAKRWVAVLQTESGLIHTEKTQSMGRALVKGQVRQLRFHHLGYRLPMSPFKVCPRTSPHIPAHRKPDDPHARRDASTKAHVGNGHAQLGPLSTCTRGAVPPLTINVRGDDQSTQKSEARCGVVQLRCYPPTDPGCPMWDRPIANNPSKPCPYAAVLPGVPENVP